MATTQVGWVWTEDVRAQWADAPLDDQDLADLLSAAYEQCAAFAPVLTAEQIASPPANYKLAQVMQARALYRSLKAGSGDTMGDDGMTVTVFPMDWTVKNLLRPKRGLPRVG